MLSFLLKDFFFGHFSVDLCFIFLPEDFTKTQKILALSGPGGDVKRSKVGSGKPGIWRKRQTLACDGHMGAAAGSLRGSQSSQ